MRREEMYASNTARLAIEEFGNEISEEGSKEFRVVVMDDGSTSPPVVVVRQEFDGYGYRQEPCTLYEAGHEAVVRQSLRHPRSPNIAVSS
jgi:hypothetical protein